MWIVVGYFDFCCCSVVAIVAVVVVVVAFFESAVIVVVLVVACLWFVDFVCLVDFLLVVFVLLEGMWMCFLLVL